MLDLPRGTVNSRLRRALDRLSGLLGEKPMSERRAARSAARRPGARRGRGGGARLAAGPAPHTWPRRRRCKPRRRFGGRRAWQVAVAVGLVAALISPAGRRGQALGRRHGRHRPRARAAGAHPLPAPGSLLVDSAARPLDRPRGRLEAVARLLRRIVMVPARPLRRRHRARTSSPRSTRSARSAGRSPAPGRSACPPGPRTANGSPT